MKGGGDKYDWMTMEVNSQMKCMISLSRIRYTIYALLRNKGDISMAECIISSRRLNASMGRNTILKTESITTNRTWVVPSHVGNISVRLFGGGGGGLMVYTRPNAYATAGGGGGWMNNREFNNISNGRSIQITIGAGGNSQLLNIEASGTGTGSGATGGTTSFGTYLSANGGSGARLNISQLYGGNGGSGGGSQSQTYSGATYPMYIDTYGGTGFQFGGGGADGHSAESGSFQAHGGNGGTYGGGGGANISLYGVGFGASYGGKGGTYGGGGGAGGQNIRVYGQGGQYGGNGANAFDGAEDGTNTIGNSQVPNNCRGNGMRGSQFGGGGGFGGNGGSIGGGGGGYGGPGGIGGGGGGGYGLSANGASDGGGGGGYYSSGGRGGGGGSYGRGADSTHAAEYGGGGIGGGDGRGANRPGGPGICIIQYYVYE